MHSTIKVEIAYAKPEEQVIIDLDVEPGITVAQAVERSGIIERFPEIDLNSNKVGVFGKLTRMDYILREGDRVEIYRKLIADPKQARRQRAEREKSAKTP